MADNTTLGSQSGGDVIVTEAILNDDGTTAAKVQVVKIMLGDHAKNGGTLSDTNPMPVQDKSVIALLEELIDEVRRGNDILEKGL